MKKKLQAILCDLDVLKQRFEVELKQILDSVEEYELKKELKTLLIDTTCELDNIIEWQCEEHNHCKTCLDEVTTAIVFGSKVTACSCREKVRKAG